MKKLIVNCVALTAFAAGAAGAQSNAIPSGADVQSPPPAGTGASPAPPTNVPGATTGKDKGDKAARLDEVVVTAQKRSQNVQTIPITIQTLNAKAINDLGIKSSTDVAEVMPNVDIALPSGAGNQPIITIRGIGLNDFDTNNTGPNGVYVDEVYLSSPGSQTFQVFDLDRIEVLKGPQGTLYGRNTSGGALNFISAKPTDTFTADVHAGYSTFDTFSLESAIGGPIASGLDGRFALVKNTSDGYMSNALTGNHENGANDIATRLLLSYKPFSNVTMLFNIHGGQVYTRPTEYRHVGVFQPSAPGTQNDPVQFNAAGSPVQCSLQQVSAGGCVDLFGYGTPQGFYNGAFDRQENLVVHNLGSNLRIDYALGSVTFTSISAFEHFDKFHPENSDASPNRLLDIDFGVNSNTITQEFRAAQNLGNLHWVLGIYNLDEWLSQDQPAFALLDFDKFYGAGSGNGAAEILFDNSNQITTSGAVFGQADYALTDKLKLTLGGRFTDESKKFRISESQELQDNGINNFGPNTPLWNFNKSSYNSAASWRTALDYSFTKRILAYVSASSGFKSADFNGGFLSSSPAEANVQTNPVAPEKVLAYELGLKTELWDRHLLFDVSMFYNDYRDMQVFTQINPVAGGSGLPLLILTNAPKAHTDGVDLQMVAKPIRYLTASLNVGLLAAKIDELISAINTSGATGSYAGNTLPLAPKTSLSGILDYKIPFESGTLDLQANANYRTKQYFDTTNDPLITQRGYWLENARIAYAFDQGIWELAAVGRNLSNQKYVTDAFDESNPFGFVQEIVGTPRSFGAQLNYSF